MKYMRHINIYTDGCSLKNPGASGYGCILQTRMEDGSLEERTYSEGYISSTNNRMELLGPIRALTELDDVCEVDLYTDSSYVVNGFLKNWVKLWESNGWKNSSGEAVKNRDLWEQLITLDKIHFITWHWIKGHNDQAENERCDRMAKEAASKENKLVDIGFIEE